MSMQFNFFFIKLRDLKQCPHQEGFKRIPVVAY